MTRRSIGWVLLLLMLLNLAFIWSNSLLPAEASAGLSAKVKAWLLKLVPGEGSAENGGHQLRKWAHFLEFCCLGMLLCGLALLRGSLTRRKLLFCWIGGVLAACADETIQRFVPDRGPSFKDVLIDTSGAAVGMILLLVGYAYVKRHKKQATEEMA